jgi:DNA-binding winged helix-turn-helix (wHTH) protein
MIYKFIWFLAFLLFAYGSDCRDTNSKEIGVVLRQIGHRLLLSNGDSTSRVLPIKEGKNDTYTISFEKPLEISSDLLYAITEEELKRIGIIDFVASLIDCETSDVYLSFLYSQELDSITPCKGRDLPTACYALEISLLHTKSSFSFLNLGFPVLLVFGALFLYYFYSKKKNKIKSISPLSVRVGKYFFDTQNRQLTFDNETTMLTEKESKLITLLLDCNSNEVQTRDYLISQIWKENGIQVVSKNLDVLVSKVRKKLSLDSDINITSVHGLGYKLEVKELTVKSV